MSNVLEKIFKIKAKGSTLKNEIIGGLIVFVSMCYVLPLNASILSDMGMNSAGVFAMTALVSAAVTFVMGFVANYPVVLSAGMGLNAYLAYTVCLGSGFTWQQTMILLTISGIIFFGFSLTPVRKWIINAIPNGLKYVISAALGAFICFVGLKNSGIIISNESTFVGIGNFANPGTIIAIVCAFICFGLMFSKKKMLSSLAIPIAVLCAAIIGLIVSISLSYTDGLTFLEGQWQYQGYLQGENVTLPIVPWLDNTLSFGLSGVEDVVFYSVFNGDGYGAAEFGNDIVTVLANPVSYIAIFSLIFVNLFDTTATLLAVGRNIGIIDEHGQMQNYQKAVLADAAGALICAPLGTSTVTSFAESNIGVEMGAKTGLSAVVAGLVFVLSAFIYPVFSVFTAGCVSAPALICVGTLIFVNNFKSLDFKDQILIFAGFITVIFTLLTYSIASGIGIGLISYVIMLLFAGRKKELNLTLIIISIVFLISFALSAIMPYIQT